MDSPATRPSVDPRTSLALWLRSGRTQSRLSLDDVARVTKIQPRILEQLETGQLEGLPAEVFVRGFVKSFARCVGLSEGEALKRYIACATATSSSATARAFIDTLGATPGRARMASGTVPPPLGGAGSSGGAKAPMVAAGELAHFTEPVAKSQERAAAEVRAEPVGLAESRRGAESAPGRTKKPRGRRRKQAQAKKLQAGQGGAAAVLTGGADAPSQVATTAAATVADSVERFVTAPAASDDATAAGPALQVVAAEHASSQVTSTALDATEPSATAVAQPVGSSLDADKQPLYRAPAVEPPAVGGRPARPAALSAKSAKVPWRRPGLGVVAKPLAPSLVIDDADPELADMQRDEREASKKPGPQRVSFLPPSLLDRDERGGRQGGLTLAVILLLIAATLTLSYLMRRPTVSGDGVTSNARDGQAVAALLR